MPKQVAATLCRSRSQRRCACIGPCEAWMQGTCSGHWAPPFPNDWRMLSPGGHTRCVRWRRDVERGGSHSLLLFTQAAGELNLSIPDPEEETPDVVEMLQLALAEEIYEQIDGEMVQAVVEEERKLGRTYALQSPSETLQKGLELLKSYRTRVLNASRSSNRVTEITVQNDCSTMLRFCGWLKSTQASSPASLDFGIFRHEGIVDTVERFCEFLVEERRCSFGTVAGYTNSLLTLVNFATSQIHEDVDNEHDDALVGALFNLRSQAESQHRDDRSTMVVLLAGLLLTLLVSGGTSRWIRIGSAGRMHSALASPPWTSTVGCTSHRPRSSAMASSSSQKTARSWPCSPINHPIAWV